MDKASSATILYKPHWNAISQLPRFSFENFPIRQLWSRTQEPQRWKNRLSEWVSLHFIPFDSFLLPLWAYLSTAKHHSILLDEFPRRCNVSVIDSADLCRRWVANTSPTPTHTREIQRLGIARHKGEDIARVANDEATVEQPLRYVWRRLQVRLHC